MRLCCHKDIIHDGFIVYSCFPSDFKRMKPFFSGPLKALGLQCLADNSALCLISLRHAHLVALPQYRSLRDPECHTQRSCAQRLKSDSLATFTSW